MTWKEMEREEFHASILAAKPEALERWRFVLEMERTKATIAAASAFAVLCQSTNRLVAALATEAELDQQRRKDGGE